MWRRRATRAARAGAEHERRCLVAAVDGAITRAVRAAGLGPVRVDAAAVQEWAAQHFRRRFPEEAVAAVLEERMRLRGYA